MTDQLTMADAPEIARKALEAMRQFEHDELDRLREEARANEEAANATLRHWFKEYVGLDVLPDGGAIQLGEQVRVIALAGDGDVSLHVQVICLHCGEWTGRRLFPDTMMITIGRALANPEMMAQKVDHTIRCRVLVARRDEEVRHLRQGQTAGERLVRAINDLIEEHG